MKAIEIRYLMLWNQPSPFETFQVLLASPFDCIDKITPRLDFSKIILFRSYIDNWLFKPNDRLNDHVILILIHVLDEKDIGLNLG